MNFSHLCILRRIFNRFSLVLELCRRMGIGMKLVVRLEMSRFRGGGLESTRNFSKLWRILLIVGSFCVGMLFTNRPIIQLLYIFIRELLLLLPQRVSSTLLSRHNNSCLTFSVDSIYPSNFTPDWPGALQKSSFPKWRTKATVRRWRRREF